MATNNIATMTATRQIEVILDTHHIYMRTELPKLIAAADKVAGAYPQNPTAIELRRNLDLLADEISAHLMKEERVLFPLIIELERAKELGTALGMSGCGVEGPMNQMEYEHITVKEVIAKLEKAIQTLGVIGDVPTLLAAIKADLYEHIRKEEDELFPAASALWKEVIG